MKKKLLALMALIMVLLVSGCTVADPWYGITLSGSRTMLVDSDGNIILIDEETKALVALSLEHHIVHEGTAFITDTIDLAMADTATLILVFKTMPSSTRAHMFFEFTTLVGGNLRVWEDVTWNTGTGGLLPIINRKRETSMTDSGILEDLTNTPLFTATNNILEKPAGLNLVAATNIHHLYAWGKKEKFLAGNVRETEGFILKPDTQYAVVFTADGANNKAQIILNWFEHASHS